MCESVNFADFLCIIVRKWFSTTTNNCKIMKNISKYLTCNYCLTKTRKRCIENTTFFKTLF